MLDTFRQEVSAFSQQSPSCAHTQTSQGIECFREFHFQILNFHLFPENWSPSEHGRTCEFPFLPPHSFKGSACDKALCCVCLCLQHSEDKWLLPGLSSYLIGKRSQTCFDRKSHWVDWLVHVDWLCQLWCIADIFHRGMSAVCSPEVLINMYQSVRNHVPFSRV